SVLLNYYSSNVDYDLNYDYTNDGNYLPAPIFDLVLWMKKKFLLLPNYLFSPQHLMAGHIYDYLVLNALFELADLRIADIIKREGGKVS
ncbi:5197_t:CDS:2, partial [Funneliformis caledonium]